MNATIATVAAATVKAELPVPIVFGDWVMNKREFVVVRVTTVDGISGWAFSLTRDGAVAEQVRRHLASVYSGTSVDSPEATFAIARGRSQPSYASGIGLRALSLVDLAVWDARARHADLSIAELLGGSSLTMPATAIVAYPPSLMGPDETGAQVASLVAEGWQRFKLSVAGTEALSAGRLRAARAAAPDAWIGCDGAWTYSDASKAASFVNGLEDVGLGWFEDVFPPGNAHVVADLRRQTQTPIAMGDEQGGAYYPQALIDCSAVDVIRIDLTCMGGISGGRRVIEECLRQGVSVAPHMYAHVHSQVLSAWGLCDLPIEWGVPWTGVDPFADSLRPVELDSGGRMRPLDPSPGFGDLVNFEWIASQEVDDPDHVLAG